MRIHPYQNGTHYYSESQDEWMAISDLPLPYIRNIFTKHMKREGFEGSPLAIALAKRLTPTRSMCKTLLATKGSCVYWCPVRSEDTKVRSMFYALGNRLGVSVKTKRSGEFIEATCDPIGEVVHVNFKQNKNSTFLGSSR